LADDVAFHCATVLILAPEILLQRIARFGRLAIKGEKGGEPR
jgi:hypothetical protein